MSAASAEIQNPSPRRDTIQIRRFNHGDEASVQKLITEIMNQEFHHAKTAFPTQDLEDIPRFYGQLGEAFFVAANGQKIIGTAAIKKEDDRVALLRRLFVSPSFRQKQIGLRLIERVIEFCQEVGYEEVIFKTTSDMEAATRVCQKCGFVPRAKLPLGALELMKFSLSLRDGRKPSKSK